MSASDRATLGMTTRELKSVCAQFRKGLLGERSSENMCYILSVSLQGYLAFLGVETELVGGSRGHYWLSLDDGRIIDSTADQFNGRWLKFPKVYIGPLPDFHAKHLV